MNFKIADSRTTFLLKLAETWPLSYILRGIFGEGQSDTVVIVNPKDVNCGCVSCIRIRGDLVDGLPKEVTQMIVCPMCGNKRCPRAQWHQYLCTRSNELNQIGEIGGREADFDMPLFENQRKMNAEEREGMEDFFWRWMEEGRLDGGASKGAHEELVALCEEILDSVSLYKGQLRNSEFGARFKKLKDALGVGVGKAFE